MKTLFIVEVACKKSSVFCLDEFIMLAFKSSQRNCFYVK